MARIINRLLGKDSNTETVLGWCATINERGELLLTCSGAAILIVNTHKKAHFYANNLISLGLEITILTDERTIRLPE